MFKGQGVSAIKDIKSQGRDSHSTPPPTETPMPIPNRNPASSLMNPLIATLAAAMSLVAPAAQANSPSQANQTSPSVFAVAAGGNGFGSWPEGGADLVVDTTFIPGIYGVFGPGSSYDAMVLPTTGTAHAQNSYALSSTRPFSPPVTSLYSGSAAASASFLPSGVLPDSAPNFQLHLSASNTGPTAVYFPLAVAQAGVTDQLTIHQAGMSGAGVLPVLFHVDGTLTADGRGSASFIVTSYVNHQVINNNVPYVSANPNLGYSIGYQTAHWRLDADGPAQSLAVNQNFEFFVPFTFDQAFTFGIYADAVAGNAAYGNGFDDSHASSDFSHTMTWLGTGPVQAGGQSLTNYSIQSASGVNWALPSAVPEPATPVLLAAGLAWLIVRRRRQA